MHSSYYGKKVSEDDLDARNASISASTSHGFFEEISKSILSKRFVMHEYLENDHLLKEVHESLEKGNPIAIEWAAKFESEWTLHFSIVTGMDLSKDLVTVYNPYGYIEKIDVEEFIARTSFESYAPLPLFLSFGFAYGVFHKNTIFYAEQFLHRRMRKGCPGDETSSFFIFSRWPECILGPWRHRCSRRIRARHRQSVGHARGIGHPSN